MGFEEGFKRNVEFMWDQADNAFRKDGFLVIEGRLENRPNPAYDAGYSDWLTQHETIEYSSTSIITAEQFD